MKTFPEDPLGGGRAGWRGIFAELCPRGIPPAEIHRHWQALLEHWRGLCTDLDRDPGLRVALVDYFQNRTGRLRDPVFMEAEWFERWSASGRGAAGSGLLTETGFARALQRELNRAIRYGHGLSLLRLRWEEGPRAEATGRGGDAGRIPEPLRKWLPGNLRGSDLAGRPGSGGLLLLLPGTGRMGAHDLGERILRHCACLPSGSRPPGDPAVPVIRGGVATFPEDGTTPRKLIDRAEAACSMAGRREDGAVGIHHRERRNRVRRPLSGIVLRLRPTDEPEVAEATAEPRDFNRRGVLLETSAPCAVGQEVWLLPPGAPAAGPSGAVRARVVRRTETPRGNFPYGLAVEIPDAGDRRRIAAWVMPDRDPASGKERG